MVVSIRYSQVYVIERFAAAFSKDGDESIEKREQIFENECWGEGEDVRR